jgi:peptidoglycan/LPS O-acetylase OafA/YrhL
MALEEVAPDHAALTPSSVAATAESASHKIVKYPYIDALRGYAVLLVILSHTGGMFPELPYPIKKLTNLGWSGVQLFFLVSCVTLMMSWRSDERKGIASPFQFWIRRFFRIAPMYYLAAIFYLIAEPPKGGFDLGQMLASLSFINAWHPSLLSTLDGGWRVVPGGWSISVEFCFYMLFPLIVVSVRSLRAGVIFCIVAIAIACVANEAVRHNLIQSYGQQPTEQFLYYWLPEQLFVFALGTILYFIIDGINKTGAPAWAKWHPALLFGAALIMIVIVGENPTVTPYIWTLEANRGPPQIFYISIILMVLAALSAANPKSIFINRPIRSLGTISFSAYIFHFFVVHTLAATPLFDASHQKGVRSIMVCGVLLLATVSVTFCLSWLSYRYVEKPMIKIGSRIASRTRKD